MITDITYVAACKRERGVRGTHGEYVMEIGGTKCVEECEMKAKGRGKTIGEFLNRYIHQMLSSSSRYKVKVQGRV